MKTLKLQFVFGILVLCSMGFEAHGSTGISSSAPGAPVSSLPTAPFLDQWRSLVNEFGPVVVSDKAEMMTFVQALRSKYESISLAIKANESKTIDPDSDRYQAQDFDLSEVVKLLKAYHELWRVNLKDFEIMERDVLTKCIIESSCDQEKIVEEMRCTNSTGTACRIKSDMHATIDVLRENINFYEGSL